MDERLTAILPCNDVDAPQAFFERLGFAPDQGSPDDVLIRVSWPSRPR